MQLDTLRLYQWARRLSVVGVPVLPDMLVKAMCFLWLSHLSPKTDVGEGTVLGYGGVGLLVHPRTRIGRNCIIAPMVSISGSSGRDGAADVGDYVRIGIGARILGPVRIGDFSVIGANAVVTQDVAPGTVMMGVPAREAKRLADPAGDYERKTGRKVSEYGHELSRRIVRDAAATEVPAATLAVQSAATAAPPPPARSPAATESEGRNVAVANTSPFESTVSDP